MDPSPPSFLHELSRGPARTLLPVLAGWAIAAGIILPPLADIVEDYFGSVAPRVVARRGADVTIGFCPVDPAPDRADPCAAAAAQSVTVTGYLDTVGALCAFVVSPGLGRMSDIYGRRPFILATFAVPVASNALLAAYYSSVAHRWAWYVDLWCYLACKAVATTVPLAMALAYIADCFSPHNRAAGFGVVLGTFSFAIFVGPRVGALLAPETALWCAVASSAAGLVAGVALLRETVTPARARTARAALRDGAPRWRAFLDSIAILARDRFFAVLAATAAIDGMAIQGLQDVSQFYLKGALHMSPGLRAAALQANGALGVLVQAVLLQPLTRCLGERRLLLLGLLGSALFVAADGLLGHGLVAGALPASTAHWLYFCVPVPLTAVAMITFPAISALKANHAHGEEQGQIQGALNGARSLASSVGPLLTAQLWHALPAAPYVVYYALASVILCAFLVAACTLPAAEGPIAGGRLKEPLLDGAADESAEEGWRMPRGDRLSQHRVVAAELPGDVAEGEGVRPAPDAPSAPPQQSRSEPWLVMRHT